MDSSSDESKSAKRGSSVGRPEQLPWKTRRSDMPKRPMSAYNIFFQDERQRILEEMNVRGGSQQSQSTQELEVRFSDLSHHIATKWNTLGEDAKGLYQALAEKEQIRYAREMVYWNSQGVEQTTSKKAGKGRKRGGDSPGGGSTSSGSGRQEEDSHSLPGPWQDATLSSYARSGYERVNSPNSKVDPTPSMRPASPMRYALDAQIPLFSPALSGQNPGAALQQWSKLKTPTTPTAASFPLLSDSRQQQQPTAATAHHISQLQARLPSPPSTAIPKSSPTSLDPAKSYLSPSLKQLSDDLDEDEQDFLISSLTRKRKQDDGDDDDDDDQVQQTEGSQPVKRKR